MSHILPVFPRLACVIIMAWIAQAASQPTEPHELLLYSSCDSRLPLRSWASDAVNKEYASVIMDLSRQVQDFVDSRRQPASNPVSLLIGPDGRAVAAVRAASSPIQEDPLGVWIWPDWCHPVKVLKFEQYSGVEFLSARYVRLQQGRIVAVVDLQNPESPSMITAKTFTKLNVDDQGHWLGVTPGGRLLSGSFEKTGIADGTVIALDQSSVEAFFQQNGAVAIVQGTDGMIRSYEAATWKLIDQAKGRVLRVRTPKGFFCEQEDDALMLVTVAADGRLTQRKMPWRTALRNETPLYVSPSGLRTITMSDTIAPGGIEYRDRALDAAIATSLNGELPRGALYGWLAPGQ